MFWENCLLRIEFGGVRGVNFPLIRENYGKNIEKWFAPKLVCLGELGKLLCVKPLAIWGQAISQTISCNSYYLVQGSRTYKPLIGMDPELIITPRLSLEVTDHSLVIRS